MLEFVLGSVVLAVLVLVVFVLVAVLLDLEAFPVKLFIQAGNAEAKFTGKEAGIP